jgi:predicted ABC-type transport system involved in lysophospholipase L1 biosynthesis ATPase subunit
MQQSRALALVLVTHDEELAAAVAHRVFEMRGGRLCQV